MNGVTREYTVGSVFMISDPNGNFPAEYSLSGMIGLGPNS